jgi:hypothetical protein
MAVMLRTVQECVSVLKFTTVLVVHASQSSHICIIASLVIQIRYAQFVGVTAYNFIDLITDLLRTSNDNDFLSTHNSLYYLSLPSSVWSSVKTVWQRMRVRKL